MSLTLGLSLPERPSRDDDMNIFMSVTEYLWDQLIAIDMKPF